MRSTWSPVRSLILKNTFLWSSHSFWSFWHLTLSSSSCFLRVLEPHKLFVNWLENIFFVFNVWLFYTKYKKKKNLFSVRTLSPSLLSFCKRSTINQLIKDSKVGPRTISLQTDLNELHWFCFTNCWFFQKDSPSKAVRSMLLSCRLAFDILIQAIYYI